MNKLEKMKREFLEFSATVHDIENTHLWDHINFLFRVAEQLIKLSSSFEEADNYTDAIQDWWDNLEPDIMELLYS